MTDIYTDDEEELCPLCIEEMDISDRKFKPCPCGYQICQFCYNNIRSEPNGRCPACRRLYDDASVEYTIVSPEELKRDHARQAQREKERKQREKALVQPPTEASKKHLAGMRVIQKNLVYVIGLNPNISTEDLHNTLRAEQFFGQYGKIQKIVINKRTNANGNLGLGVYVTFVRKEDAAKCINAVDGSLNDGKYLRAAYGTTKYCSSYLRGQACPNPNCMFLHEPGEDADSYTRRDLSAMQHRNPPSVVPPGLPSLTQATVNVPTPGFSGAPQYPVQPAPLPAATPVVSAAPLPTANAWNRPKKSTTPLQEPPNPASTTPVRNPIDVALNSLAELSNASSNYSFSCPIKLDLNAVPQYLSFNLSSDARLSQFKQQWQNVSAIEAARVKYMHMSQQQQQQYEPTPPSPPTVPSTPAQDSSATLGSSPTSTQQTTPPPGLFGSNSNAQNSQELLAHLMKGKSKSQKLNKQLNRYFERESPISQAVMDGMEPGVSHLTESSGGRETSATESAVLKYTAGGSTFSVHDLPKVGLVGDSEPSIWAGIEKLTRNEAKLQAAQQKTASLAAQQKKLQRQINSL